MPRQRVGRIGELEVVHHLRQPIDLRGVEAERLAHFARGAPPAIGDDVGRHRRAEPAVFFVDVLDDPLAPIAARQIEIDVRPLAALLRQKPLEQQIHADRIDRRDAEAVADGAVGRRAAALHEDVVLAAEVHDVPDDEEVAGEIELLDEIELARDLGAGAIVIRPVAIARADLRHPAQKRRLRLAGRHRDSRESGSRDRPSCTAADRPARAFAAIASGRSLNSAAMSSRRLQIPLGVRRQPPAGVRQIGVVVDARQHVEERPLGRRREPDAAGGDDRHPERRGHRDERAGCRPLRRGGDAAAARRSVRSRPKRPTRRSSRPPTPNRRVSSAARPASATRPAVWPSSSSSVSAPSPFGARSFMRVIRRQRLR